jgi:hypothetical protein
MHDWYDLQVTAGRGGFMKVAMCFAAALAFCGFTLQLQGQCPNASHQASEFGSEQTYQGVYKQDPANPFGALPFTEDDNGKVWVIEDPCGLLYRLANQHLVIKARVRTIDTRGGPTNHLNVDSVVSVLGVAAAAITLTTPTPGGQSPCSLLTATEVTSAIGSSVKEGVERRDIHGSQQNFCAWATITVAPSVPNVVILTWMTTADFATINPNNPTQAVQPQSGVGDVAYGQVARGYKVFVRKGDKAFSLYIQKAGTLEGMQKLAPAATALAKEAATRL